jgi:hypothetical protein
MTITFRSLSILYALICFGAAVIWTCAPRFLLSAWGVDFSESSSLAYRQCGALFFGIGVVFFYARKAEPSFMRTTFVRGFGVSCLILAGLGVMELVNGRAGPGILSAVAVEVLLVLLLPFAVGIGPTPTKGRS